MKRTIVIVALVAAALISIAAYGAWRDRSPAERTERLTERLSIKLELTPAQKEAAGSVALALVQEQDAFAAAQGLLARDLQKHLESDDFGLQAFQDDWRADVGSLGARHDETLRRLEAFHRVLQPSQRAEAAALLRRFLTPPLWSRQ